MIPQEEPLRHNVFSSLSLGHGTDVTDLTITDFTMTMQAQTPVELLTASVLFYRMRVEVPCS